MLEVLERGPADLPSIEGQVGELATSSGSQTGARVEECVKYLEKEGRIAVVKRRGGRLYLLTESGLAELLGATDGEAVTERVVSEFTEAARS